MLAKIEFEEVRGYWVAKIFVPRGDEPLYFLDGMIYVRYGDSDVQAQPALVKQILSTYKWIGLLGAISAPALGFIGWDALSDLSDFARVKRRLRAWRQAFDRLTRAGGRAWGAVARSQAVTFRLAPRALSLVR